MPRPRRKKRKRSLVDACLPSSSSWKLSKLRLPRGTPGAVPSSLPLFRSFGLETGDTCPLFPNGSCSEGGGGGGRSAIGGCGGCNSGAAKLGPPRTTASGLLKAKPPPEDAAAAEETRGTQPVGRGSNGGLGAGSSGSAAGPSPPGGGGGCDGNASSRSSSSSSDSFRFRTFTRRALRNILLPPNRRRCGKI